MTRGWVLRRTNAVRDAVIPRSCICGWVARKGNQYQPARWNRIYADPDCPWHHYAGQ